MLQHYENLPNQTLFLQESMAKHNAKWMLWARCLLPSAEWAPLTPMRLQRNVPNSQMLDGDGSYDALIEQCWRDLLAAFNRSAAMPRRKWRVVRYFAASLAVASRRQLRRHPRSVYEVAHSMLAGGDGRCVRGELQWAQLRSKRTNESLLYDAPLGRGKHTSANAYESLHAVLLGGLGLEDAIIFDYCSVYRHKSVCPHSPCPAVAPVPGYVSKMYRSPLFTAKMRQERDALIRLRRETG